MTMDVVSTDGTVDMGPIGSDARPDTRTDTGTDSGPMGSIFIPCTTNAMCGTGGTCLTTFPGGGICTRRCTNDRACGPDGVCETQNMICLPACSSGGGECDQYGGGCVPLDDAFTMGACLPSCYGPGTTPPTGYPACAAPMPMCDPYSGVCVTMQPMGAADGDPCTADGDCAGNRCITELDATTNEPTGWVGGYCLSFARAGNLMQGQPVPPSNCPPGAGVVPLGGEQPGDLAPCFHTCNASSDCRAGYQCDHLQPAMGTGNFFSNGICLPVDCNTSGMTCPSGYHCVTQPSDAAMPPGQCEAGAADAGVVPDVVVPDVVVPDASVGDVVVGD